MLKCFHPIRLQDSLITNISGSNHFGRKEFLHGGIRQRTVASDIATFGLVWSGLPSHTQMCLALQVLLSVIGLGQMKNSLG